MGDRPNIFKYATKELSQDAMICWFLECLNSKDEFYKNIGMAFARLIDVSIKDEEISVYGPYPQCYHMDVYAVLCVGNTAIPLIFEDKTDTYLHSDQMKEYCKKVNSWKDEKYLHKISEKMNLKGLSHWGDTRYIYFKTGYVPEWQKNDIEKEENKCENVIFKNIYIDEWIEFLSELPSEDLIGDYIEHMKQKKKDNEEGNFAKWDNVYHNIFGKYIRFESSYQGWAAKSFMYFDEGKEERHIWYSLRCGWWKKTGYAIAFQQYRNESKIKRKKDEFREKRNTNTDEIKEICKDIFTKLNKYGFDFDKYVEDNKGKEQNNFFKISIEDNKDGKAEDNVCNFFKEFLKLFIDAVKEKYGDRVKITENIEWKE